MKSQWPWKTRSNTDERVVSPYQVKRARDYLTLRVPALHEHFIIQKHPALSALDAAGSLTR